MDNGNDKKNDDCTAKMTTLTHLRAAVLSRSPGNASSSSTGGHGVCVLIYEEPLCVTGW